MLLTILGDWENYAYKSALKIEINNKYWFLPESYNVEKYFDTLLKSPFKKKKRNSVIIINYITDNVCI